MKFIEVKIKIPKDWIDDDGISDNRLKLLSLLAGRTQERMKRDVFAGAVEKIIEKTKLPKVKITKEEVKDRMLDIMAQRALDGNDK